VRQGLALIGDGGIASSVSPAIHDAIFGRGTYGLLIDDDAARAFSRAEASLRGVNVTAPHKLAAALRYAPVVDDVGRRTGAINTVVYDDEGRATLATNTDVEGLRVAWRRANVILENRRLVVVGAGGAARAVVVAAAEQGVASIGVIARRRAAAAAIVNVAASIGLDASLAELEPAPADVLVLAASHLDNVDELLESAVRKAGVVHELRYGRRAVPSRNAALRRGLVFVDGASMVLAQALAAATAFSGAPPTEAARARAAAALAEALKNRS
jgi:shikimate dehydrogenase